MEALKQQYNSTLQVVYRSRNHAGTAGSIVALMNESSNIVEETNYDPWGRVRNPNDWTYANAQPLSLIYRGFTGHEMLPEFGLINMNGRLYDPALGRFLSPDNYVQDPNNPQNYNRYAYAMNNPLKYTDPDGEFWNLIIGGLIGGTINWIAHGAEFSWEGLAYFGVGALAGALSAGIGAGVSSALAGGSFGAGFIGTSTVSAATSFTSGAIIGSSAGFGNDLIKGESFGNSLINGIGTGVQEGVIGGLAGGFFSGIDAVKNGRDFWTGETKKYFTYNGMNNVKTIQTIKSKYQPGTPAYDEGKIPQGIIKQSERINR